MSLKYIKLFENSDEIAEKNILDNLIILIKLGVLSPSDIDFTETSPSGGNYEIYVQTEDGTVGFNWDDEEPTEYTGDGWWDMEVTFDRIIDDTQYVLVANGSGRGPGTGDEVELKEITSILNIYSKSVTKKAR